MNELLWKKTHETSCPQSTCIEKPCTCNPQKRIQLIQHLIAGYPLDIMLRKAMLHEIEKYTSK